MAIVDFAIALPVLEDDTMEARRSDSQLRDDAQAIWQAGVDAVDSRRLVVESISLNAATLQICDAAFPLDSFDRIIVIGAGKAGAGMSQGVLDALGDELCDAKQLAGWVNVPSDCVRNCGPIQLHAARPAGVNEPRPEGVAGAEQIIRLAATASERDLVICLLSGGGSALLPAPVEGVSLQDKQTITRLLSGAGANILELNTVRKQLSRVKGGRLARQCRAAIVTLIISDVIGDPLDVIASGPTVPDSQSPADALDVLTRLNLLAQTPPSVLRFLQSHAPSTSDSETTNAVRENFIIGNNAVAVDAAGIEAERRGYSHAMISATESEGPAESVGHWLADMVVRMKTKSGPDCLISGGEPIVKLAPESRRGRGGRNQQLVLAAAQRLVELDVRDGFALLSGGTDGEDGPTDAAGAFCVAETLSQLLDAAALRDLEDALQNNDAYSLLDRLGGLLRTGPTHTNVCDLRIALVDRKQPQQS